MSMVNVGGKLYNADAKFKLNRGYGESMATAAQAAAWYNTAGNVSRSYAINDAWQNYDGYIELADKGTDAKKAAPAPKKAAPKKRTVLTKSAPRKEQPAAPQQKKPITKEEQEEVTREPDGLEGTIKTQPALLREKRRRTYLTRSN